MLKIIRNPNVDKQREILDALRLNQNYCPCKLVKTPDTKCPCKEFREQTIKGECHCGLYVKVDDGK